ncbi:MAG TPA: glycosyltransferase family 39 protein [Pyrinomonadaceae bacterium]
MIRQEQPGQGYSFSERRGWVAAFVLISLFLLTNVAILLTVGIHMGGDSLRYVGGAENLLRGSPLQERQSHYTGYLLLIAFCRVTGIGLPGVIAIQLLMAGLAAFALYDLGRKLHGESAGLFAAGLFAANPDIARWNAYILTDSLYISFVTLAVWSVYKAFELGRHWYVLAVAVLVAATLIRPNGSVLILVSLLYLSSYLKPGTRSWLVISAILLASILGALVVLRFYTLQYSDNPVIALRYGTTGIGEWGVLMPSEPGPFAGEWTDLIGYVARHPLASLRLCATRVAIELVHARPFFSFKHNALLLATLPVIYLLALMGLKLNRNRALTRLIVLTITAHLAVVAATYADWDGRFLLYALPLICLLSSCALASLIASCARALSPKYTREPAPAEDDSAIAVIE